MRIRLGIIGMLIVMMLSVRESDVWAWNENREITIDDPYFFPSSIYWKDRKWRPMISRDVIYSLISEDVLNKLGDYLKNPHERLKEENKICYLVTDYMGSNILSRMKVDPRATFINSYQPMYYSEFAFQKMYEWYEKNRDAITLSRLREICTYSIIERYSWYKTFYDEYNYPYNHKIDSILDVIEKESALMKTRPFRLAGTGLSDEKLDSVIDAECKFANEEFYFVPRKLRCVIKMDITPEFFNDFESVLKHKGENSTAYDLVLVGELGKYFRTTQDSCTIRIVDSNNVWIEGINGIPIPTDCAYSIMLEWYEAHGAALTIDRMRELLRLKREIDHADFKGTDPSKYYSGIDSLFNVMESESVVNVTDCEEYRDSGCRL